MEHCAHWQEGIGNCCHCGAVTWCPEEGTVEEIYADYKKRKDTCGEKNVDGAPSMS